MFEKVKRKTVAPNIQQSLNQQQQQSHQLTPESISTGITPTFSAAENASKLRRPYPYASGAIRDGSPVPSSSQKDYYMGTSTIMEDSNNDHFNSTLRDPLHHSLHEGTPASPLPVHPYQHNHHNGRTGGYLLTAPYLDQRQQPTSVQALSDEQNHSSRITQQQQKSLSSVVCFFFSTNYIIAISNHINSR